MNFIVDGILRLTLMVVITFILVRYLDVSAGTSLIIATVSTILVGAYYDGYLSTKYGRELTSADVAMVAI